MSDYEGRFYDAMSENETLTSELESLRQQLAEQAEAIDLQLHTNRRIAELEEKVAKWVEKAKNWTASPEAGKQLEGYRTMGAKCAELESERDQLRQQLAAKQAAVDALMLEYCPSEMSQEQLDNWAAHQRPSEWKTNDELRKQLAERDAEVKLLRSTIQRAIGTCFDRQSYERCMADPTYFINVALTATEPK